MAAIEPAGWRVLLNGFATLAKRVLGALSLLINRLSPSADSLGTNAAVVEV